MSDVMAKQTRVAHVGEVGVLALLLNVGGVGTLAWLLYVGDGGLLARVLDAHDVGVLARVLDAGDVGAAIVSLLLLPYVTFGVAVSHGPVKRAPLGPASAAASLFLLRRQPPIVS